MANLLDFLDRPEKITLTELIPVYKAWYETADTPKFPKICVVPDNFAKKQPCKFSIAPHNFG